MTNYANGNGLPEEPLLTPNEVASLAGLHPEVIRREIRRGNLKAHKLTGRLRISRAAYHDWLKRNLH